MGMNQRENFGKFLLDSFGDGVFSRELRLSKEELTYLKELYPKANVTISSKGISENSKNWYEVNLLASKEDKEMNKAKKAVEMKRKVRV